MQANPPDPQLVALSVKIYRSLVRLYPLAFRAPYADLMVQAFRDCCLQANRQNSPTGLLSLWVHTLLDVLLTLIEQYANRGAVMTKSKWIKLSGWFLAASGILLWAGLLASSRPPFNQYNAESWPVDFYFNAATYPLLFSGMLLNLLGNLGLQLHFGRKAGRLGQAGLVLSLVGGAAALVGFIGLGLQANGAWWETAMLGTTGLFIGLGLFGVNCIRLKLFSRWNSLPLLVSLPWPVMVLISLALNSMLGDNIEVPGIILASLFTISFAGMALIGYLLQANASASPPSLT